MAKKKMRWPALLLSLAMVVSLLPAYAAAADTSTWNVSKSKTATELNNDETTVTLSLPSAQETLASDVVFVLDGSSCADYSIPKAVGLIKDLMSSEKQTNASIKVGIVIFKGSAVVAQNLQTLDDTNGAALVQTLDNIKSEADVTKYLSSIDEHYIKKGSNLPSGLEKAQTLLSVDTDVLDTKKYVVTVTDGLTYLFNNAQGETCGIFNNHYCGYSDMYDCLLDEWTAYHEIEYKKDIGYVLPSDFDWATYYAAVVKNVGNDAGKFDIARSSRTSKDDSGWRVVEKDNSDYASFVVGTNVIDCCDDNNALDSTKCAAHAFGVDRSVYESMQAYTAMHDLGYNCYAVNPSYNDETTFGGLVTSKLNAVAGKSENLDFTTVKNDILYAINSGSVTDVIGDSFDLVQPTDGSCPFTIKVGDTVYTATADTTTANRWNFNTGELTSNPYTVEYKPATETDKEQLVWTINVPVENLNRVSLSYTLKLVNKQTAAGNLYTLYERERNAELYFFGRYNGIGRL